MAIAMLVACMFGSCSDDDDDLGSSSDLVGTWVVVLEEGYMIEDGEKETFKEQYDVSDPEYMVTFEADGTFFNDEGGEGTWEYSNGTLTIQYENGDDFKIKVIKLTSSEMVTEVRVKDGGDEYYEKTTFRKIKK
jgi:hypothetical protein